MRSPRLRQPSGCCRRSHVIGTLWPISDITARRLARDFYTRLTHHGTTPPDTSLAACALHHATRRLRDRYPAAPRYGLHTPTPEPDGWQAVPWAKRSSYTLTL